MCKFALSSFIPKCNPSSFFLFRMRQNRMAMDQQAQLNAPDPRETLPPCYQDALLLPRLDGSFASLNELGQKKEHKLGVHVIHREAPEDTSVTIEPEEPQITPRNRCRSEEVLSMRDIVSNRRSGKYRTPTNESNFEEHHYANISRSARRSNSRNRIPTSPPPTRIPTPPPDLPPPPPIPGKPTGAYQSNLELHYHSTEILNMLPHGQTSKQSVPLSPVLSQGSDTGSAEYDDLQDFNGAIRDSPYSRRKSRNLTSFKASSDPLPDEIVVVENHYPRMPTPKPRKRTEEEDISTGSSQGDDSESFEAISTSDLTRGVDEVREMQYAKPEQTAITSVQVHRQPRESSL